MSKELLTWYDQVMRELPWRSSKDPYRIWLSEIMLQQTQVVTVVSYFNKFISRFPDVKSLALAEESEVFKLWEGLGYYSRAKNLIRCARVVVEEYGAKFPRNSSELMKLPGIGPYTAGAIASIAYDEITAAIDGNVLRVISRLNCIDLPINNLRNIAAFKPYVMAMMTERPGDFNQALMELGATVCTPKTFKCKECPLKSQCCAFEMDRVSLYPNKPKKSAKKELAPIIIILVCEGEVMIVKHPNEGLLNNLWGFPRVDVTKCDDQGDIAKGWIAENLGIHVEARIMMDGKPHVFTHLKWSPVLFFYELVDKIEVDYPIMQWTRVSDLKDKALPTAMTKQLEVVEEGMRMMKQKKSEQNEVTYDY